MFQDDPPEYVADDGLQHVHFGELCKVCETILWSGTLQNFSINYCFILIYCNGTTS